MLEPCHLLLRASMRLSSFPSARWASISLQQWRKAWTQASPSCMYSLRLSQLYDRGMTCIPSKQQRRSTSSLYWLAGMTVRRDQSSLLDRLRDYKKQHTNYTITNTYWGWWWRPSELRLVFFCAWIWFHISILEQNPIIFNCSLWKQTLLLRAEGTCFF